MFAFLLHFYYINCEKNDSFKHTLRDVAEATSFFFSPTFLTAFGISVKKYEQYKVCYL